MKASKYVLILVKTSHERTPYDVWLQDTNITPIILVSSLFYEGYKHLKHVYSFNNYETNNLVEKKALEIAKETKITSIFARAESDIIRASLLRKKLNIEGQNIDSAIAYRNKITMKNKLQNTPINVPNHKLVNSTFDILDFIEKYNYPVVIKPILESGSTGVNIINNDSELDTFLSKKVNFGNIEINTFIHGDMYTVDGLILDNEIVYIQPSKYINNCLSFLQNEYLGAIYLDDSDTYFNKLVNVTKEVIKKLPNHRNMIFHAEFWIDNTGKITFCEIASRIGGAMIPNAWKFGFLVDIDKILFLKECGVKINKLPILKNKKHAWITFQPIKGTLKKLPTNKSLDYITSSVYNGRIGDTFNGGIKSGLFLSGYTLTGRDNSDINIKISSLIEWYNKNILWDNIND